MMLHSNLKEGDKVYFIPYTTDTPVIKQGTISMDAYGKLFIKYMEKYADDGEWYICKVSEWDTESTRQKLAKLMKEIYKGNN